MEKGKEDVVVTSVVKMFLPSPGGHDNLLYMESMAAQSLLSVDKEISSDMELVCLWCGKFYSPYNHLVSHDYAYFGFCNDRCFMKYQRYGKIRNVLKAPSRLFWRCWYGFWNFVYSIRYSAKCPLCKKPMERTLGGIKMMASYYACSECGDMYSIKKKKGQYCLEAI